MLDNLDPALSSPPAHPTPSQSVEERQTTVSPLGSVGGRFAVAFASVPNLNPSNPDPQMVGIGESLELPGVFLICAADRWRGVSRTAGTVAASAQQTEMMARLAAASKAPSKTDDAPPAAPAPVVVPPPPSAPAPVPISEVDATIDPSAPEPSVTADAV